MAIWLKDGKLITDANGKPIVCNNCPCGGVECREAVDAQVATLLAEIDPETQAHVWALYGTFEPDYTCAQWHYDSENEEWVLDSMATGKLAIALQYGTVVTDTTNCIAHKFTYAKVLYSVSQHMYKTIGCECHVSDHECKHTKVVKDDYCIAGELDVWQPDQSDSGAIYEPSSACEVDPCKLLKLKMETAHYWHGGQLMGEGYYDWLLVRHKWDDTKNLRYQPFLMAIKWEVETSESESTSTSESVTPVYNVTYLNCGCTNILTHTLQDEETVLEYEGICTLEHPCKAMMLLHNHAEAEGWIWHGEGVLAHLNKVTTYGGTTVYGDWYELLEQSWQGSGRTCSGESISFDIYMACAETPTSYKLVGCDCYVYSEEKTKDQPTTGYWKYFDLDGVCGCSDSIKDGNNPIRELLLTYPEEFGIIEFQYGNNSLFVYDNGSGEKCYCCADSKEPVQGTSGQTMFVDYRALCWIGRVLYSDGTEKRMVRVCYPDGSKGVPAIDGNLHYCTPPTHDPKDVSWWICDTAEFKYGYWQPFTYCPYLSWSDEGWKQFSGHHYGWGAGQVKWSDQDAFHDGQIGGCQPTEKCDYWSREQAEEAAGCGNDTPTPCISVDTTTAHLWQYMPVLAPDFTVSDHPCSIREIVHEEHEDMGDGESWDWTWSEWCVIPRWTTFGVNIGTKTESWGDICYWSILNVNYVETNKGLLVKGLAGYQESYVLIGASHYPEYTWCWSDECKNPRIDPWSGEIYDPCHWLDETIDCPADEDMHSCLGFEDWQFPDESDSSSSSDTSDSSSSIGE